jgi:ribulose-5-phosphate 4-epimerase/fuculose-1-phosphate aldolase
MAINSLDTLIQDLVIANRILAKEEVVDAYGHVSVRHPDNPSRFLIARSVAPVPRPCPIGSLVGLSRLPP